MRSGFPIIACLLLSCLPLDARALRAITRCPQGSRPARTPDPRSPWVCILLDERYRKGIDCPAGSQPVTTSDAYDPFKCAVSDVRLSAPRGACPPGHRPIPASEASREYDCEKIEPGFAAGPQCPRGYRPLPTPNQMRAFRCERDLSQSEEPAAALDFGASASTQPRIPKPVRCPPGAERRATENPFEPVECVDKAKAAPKVPGNADYRRYRLPGELSFDYPKDWHLSDAWRDETPSIYLQLDLLRDGRPVTLSITRQRQGASGYVDMKTAIWREKDWHGAMEEARTDVDGRPSAHLGVQKESKTVFIRLSDSYLALSYGAPSDLFDRYLPVYDRLLKTFKIETGKK
ncbi:MAG: hypothetical protein HY922_11915 [Elusimicrobia bacterium]|nr:hypothetical protein [Elusimicrobiota bacterium]